VKLIIAIVHERDRQKASDALLQAGHKFTVVASTGGFLRDGNTTLLIGVPTEQVDEVTGIIGGCCRTREQFVNQPPPDALGAGGMMLNPIKVDVGGAIMFVMDVEKVERV
jgi:uncharacterized protein YaaQ